MASASAFCFDEAPNSFEMLVGRFTDSGSVLSWDISSAKIAGASSFRPSNNYGYSTRDPQSAKNWVVRYAGAQSGALTY